MTTTVSSIYYTQCSITSALTVKNYLICIKTSLTTLFSSLFFNDFQSLDIQICLMYQLYEIKIALRFQQRFRWIFSTVVEWFPIILSAFPFELSVEGTVLHLSVWLLTLKKTSNLIHFPSWRQFPLKLKF